jgi:peptidoglycan/xylan/chitin deacetylase (PgdA/CDA1 family)
MTADMEEARHKEIVAVKPIVARLKETGWYFGSHSWGHISLSTSNLKTVKEDMSRWLNEVGSLVGSTKLFFYPFGARPDGDDVQQSGEIFQISSGEGLPRLRLRRLRIVLQDQIGHLRRHLRQDARRRGHAAPLARKVSKFYDAKLVFDYDVRPDYGKHLGIKNTVRQFLLPHRFLFSICRRGARGPRAAPRPGPAARRPRWT